MYHSIDDEFSRQARQMASAPAFHAELQRLARAVDEGAADTVLDLACGPGIVAEAIAPIADRVIGIDATAEMVRLARQRFARAHRSNGCFEVARAEQIPLRAGCCNQVITRLSFHHFSDVPAVLSEVRRVLPPAGRLVVADVVSSEEREESSLHNSLERLRDPTHIHMFPASELLELLRIEGFQVVHHETWRQGRAFPEWAAIVADPKRTAPLENVMRGLARAGQTAGIDLHEESGEIRFAHTWLLAIAKAASSF